MVRYILGRMLGVEALLLLLPAFVGILYGEEKEALTFVIPAVILTCIFVIAGRKRPEGQVIYGKEGMVVVASAWITWSLFGALPFTLSGSIPNFVDAFFETVSGFTTTGSSILRDVEALPQCMLFWRSFTHWIGGMGVLVFVLMLTNLDKKNSMYLMRAEVPGPEKDKLVPKSITTARILFGINFNLYYFMLLGDFKAFWKNEELRVYLGIIATATILITLNTNQMYGSIMKAFRYALFQVSTIITTTGYATTDFNLWPTFSQCIVVLLMIIGACASSTGGGIKVSRLMIVFKGVKREIKQLVHPKSVNLIRINRKKISDETLRGVYVYLMAYALLAIVSVLIISLDNQDFTTTFTSVMATLNNIGPGLSAVGPTGNFADFSILSKIVFCIDMLAGRLEIFPFLTFLTMFAWKRKF